MQRYVAFLRGINVNGRNKISMLELKRKLETLNFYDIKTYLNSGNVAFSSHKNDVGRLKVRIESMIKEYFYLDIPVFVVSKIEIEDILNHAPEWWDDGNKEIYNNLIFIIPPESFFRIYKEIGEPKKELEKIESYKEVIFWSFNRNDYQKTNWWSKTASADISKKLTIRTAKTVKKIANM